ncbi:MAG: hypothetical protein M1426_00640 [Patescibacteria group bacterium]|nr:hypothetical protein [Patescibacteria group bacterium]
MNELNSGAEEMKRLKTIWSISLVVISISIFTANGMTDILQEYPLSIGWAAVDITPSKPVALNGQFYTRISQYVRDPLMATALAFETKTSNGQNDEAIMISIDMVGIDKDVQDELRTMLHSQLPDFDVRKLFINAP